ncbi:MAG: hypothetical protein ACR2M0_12680 [Chloroflexia bacterium]
MIRPRLEPSGILAGVLLAGLLLGIWNSGVLAGAHAAYTRPGLHLSGYLGGTGAALAQGISTDKQPDGQPVAPQADAQHVVGQPSLSAAQIDSILGEYSSPAAGQGAVFYSMGLKYGIDPAFALAFYVHESHCGTLGVARFTHAIGNIRWTPGFISYEGYRSYTDFQAGIEDWFKLIRQLYVDGWGLQTVDAILPRYAPPADNNNTAAYISDVEALVASWRARKT